MPVGEGERMLVCAVGDVMLDVVVHAPTGLASDDDTPARIDLAAGGQAANVATWVSALGGRSRLFGPRSSTGPGRLVGEQLGGTGVEMDGPLTSRLGRVLSLVTSGTRTLASDPGSPDWLDEVRPGSWLDGADWLFVSGYALLRSREPRRMVDLASAARSAGTAVAVDLSSASMIQAYGAARFHRLWQALQPSAVFATDEEWTATNAADGADSASRYGAGGTAVLVLKHGPRGATFVIDGVADDRPPVPGPVADVTGSGDALAAGFLVGGVKLAMHAAARCVAHVGAQPGAAS